MDNSLWNGQNLISSEIAKDYSLEKEIRKASGRGELHCPDSECQHPTLRYCHGEKKIAFFAHLHLDNEHCDYACFDKENTQIMRAVRKIIYEQFKLKGFDVRTEEKVLDHHYTHLLFYMDDGSRVAVEIGTQQVSANRIDALTEEYHSKNITVNWIVIGNTDTVVLESQTYHIKRNRLNESKNKDLLVVSWDGKKVAQYKADPNQYEYKGRPWTSYYFPETYIERAPIDKLTIDSGELTLTGFDERYLLWLKQKRSAFEEKVLQLNEESKQKMEASQRKSQEEKIYRQQLWQRNYEGILSAVNTSLPPISVDQVPAQQAALSGTYHPCNDEILLALIEQQIEPARDSDGNRWVKCEKCERIGIDDEFVFYGGSNHVNLGICKNCRDKS